MAWDEALFSLAWDGARKLLAPRVSSEVQSRRFELAPERERLEALARLLSGAPLEVVLTDEPGGCSGDRLFLPRYLDFGPTRAFNEDAMRVRVAWACSARALGLVRSSRAEPLLVTALAAPRVRARLLADFPSLAELLPRLERAALDARPPPGTDPASQAVEATVRLALQAVPDEALSAAAWVWAKDALSGAARELPSTRRWLRARRPLEAVPLWGELLASPPRPPPTAMGAGAETVALPDGTEKKKRAVTSLERLQEPDNQLAENPLVHSFEKVHTLETYKGGSKRIDGDDELGAHQKALDELDLRQVVRSHQRARSLYRADVLIDGAVGELEDDASAPAEALYDEWDEAKRQWRREWCRLTTRVVPVSPAADAQLKVLRGRLGRATAGLRAVFEQLEASRAWRLRQLRGPDVDIDAVVSRHAALKAGHCSEQRLYSARRRHSRDTAVLVLLDASLSTDAWVANRRVLDVEKEAVIALGDALEGLFDEFAVAAFCSQSRRDCRFLVAKTFSEPWARGAQRVMCLEPGGFTRIGPAIRHATAELQKCGARQKLLLVVSDGKPSDIDRYEGRYGVADVRRAVLDADAGGVVVHALAVDPAASAWLPAMFGHGRASVVSRSEELVDVMAAVTATALR